MLTVSILLMLTVQMMDFEQVEDDDELIGSDECVIEGLKELSNDETDIG